MQNEKKPTIFFTIEHLERELYSKAYLASEAARRGFRCYIGSFPAVLASLHYAKPSIVFHKSTWTAWAQKIKDLGHSLVFLDEEAGFAIPRAFRDEFVRWRYRTTQQEPYEKIFTINNAYTERIKNAYHQCITPVTTGWPRIDLWRPENFERLVEKSHSSDRESAPILFISTFGATNERQFRKRMQSAPSKRREKVIEDKWLSFKRHQKFIDQLSELCGKRQEILIRPHPSESIRDWKQFMGGKSNISLDSSIDIAQSLYDAKAIVNPGSTAGVQGALLGVPSVTLDPPTEDGIGDTPVYEVSTTVYSAEEALEKIHELSRQPKESISGRAKEMLRHEIASLEGETAASKILSSLQNTHIADSPPVALSKNEMYYLKSRYKAHKLLAALGVRKKEKLRGGIKQESIRHVISRLEENSESVSRYIIEPTAVNLVKIDYV